MTGSSALCSLLLCFAQLVEVMSWFAVGCVGSDVALNGVDVAGLVRVDVQVFLEQGLPFDADGAAKDVVGEVGHFGVEDVALLLIGEPFFEVGVDLMLRAEVANGPGGGLGLVGADEHDGGAVGQGGDEGQRAREGHLLRHAVVVVVDWYHDWSTAWSHLL